MRELSSQSKVCVVPVAVAASLGMVGAGLVSNGIVMADSLSDTVNITVTPSCTFNDIEGEEYIGSAPNGAVVNNFNDNGQHVFNIFCNDNNGFEVTATPSNLGDSTNNQNLAKIAYTNNFTHTGDSGQWTAEITADPSSLVVNEVVPIGGGKIISSNSHTSASGVNFTAEYKAYVGSSTPAGTYTGSIEYTLTASGTSNTSNSNSGNNSQSGTKGNTNNSTQNGTQSNTNSTKSVTTLSTTNNYTTNTNTYSTTNYQGIGSTYTPTVISTPAVTPVTTSSSSTATDDEGDSSSTSSSYKQALGVTSTTKSSSSKGSDAIDPAPIVVAGMIATSGLAAVALVKGRSKEEE